MPIASSSTAEGREYSPNAPYDLSYVGIFFVGGTLLNCAKIKTTAQALGRNPAHHL